MYQFNTNSCLNSDIWLERDSQEEYGCHAARFNNNLREKICIHCHQRKPTSLEELSFSVILEDTELLNRVDSALCHLPHRICWLIGRALNANLLYKAWKLVGLVSEYGETRPSWFDVDQSKTVFLTRFRLYCEVYHKLKPYMSNRSAGIDEILLYLSDVDSTYEDFWSTMISAITKLKAETDSEDSELSKNIIYAEKSNVVLVNARDLIGENRPEIGEYESMKELQRLNKTFSCPVVFKPTTIGHVNLESHEIPHLLDNIDPEVIVDADIKKTSWLVGDIDELGRVLSACNNLTSIYLRQKPQFDEVLEDVTSAVSRFLIHSRRLQKIGLTGFNLAGTLAKYPLPVVENLRLRLCIVTEEDLNFMVNRSDLALKSLVFSSCHHDVSFPSLSVFIQNQAKSLEDLELEYPAVSVIEICHLLRVMAKFNRLRVFDLNCVEVIDFISIERIIVDLMSIHSTRTFFLDIRLPADSVADETMAAINHLNDVVREMCKINRRPPIKIILNLNML